MRVIQSETIINLVRDMCIAANCILNKDIEEALQKGLQREVSPIGRDILCQLIENSQIAKDESIPICQDTGMVICFIELGQEVYINGGLSDAINEGVRRGYKEGFLRKSVVADPLIRNNTGDNTPAIIHYDVVPGDKFKITIMPKGFGSENMSSVKMLKPSDGIQGVFDFVVETCKNAGPNPCPPMVVGVGIGGSMEKAALLSKQALARPLHSSNAKPHLADLENKLLNTVNKIGIGPAGLGGRVTALGVNIEDYPTHIAGLPVAVNISCHATRHVEKEI